jgi:hypothetical protein
MGGKAVKPEIHCRNISFLDIFKENIATPAGQLLSDTKRN